MGDVNHSSSNNMLGDGGGVFLTEARIRKYVAVAAVGDDLLRACSLT